MSGRGTPRRPLASTQPVRRAPPPPPPKKAGRRWLRVLLYTLAGLMGLGAVGGVLLAVAGYVVYQREARGLGDITQLINTDFGGVRITDRNGQPLYEAEDPDSGLRAATPLARISPYLINATVATEDASFYTNPGINLRGIIRAGIENIVGREGFGQGSGGSSITQQLVKNVLIPEDQRYERSAKRKVKETVLAIEIARRYPKDQILEWYLNQIYYGNRAYGVGAASQRYFGVTPDKLTLGQASLLAGLPQSPIAYDPLVNLNAARGRQGEVLDLMVLHGKVSRAEADAARAEPLSFNTHTASGEVRAPHWVYYIRQLLIDRYGEAAVNRGGLRVTTTLDLDLQQKGQEIVDQRVTEFEKQDCGCHNGSLVAIDNNTGQILAMVGSRDFNRQDIQGEVNNATAIKEPGSALKPAVYLAAFLKGWSPATTVWDVAKTYPNPGGEPFTPVGPTAGYQGVVTVRTALGSSLNAPAVAAAAYASVPAVIDTAHKLGISSMSEAGGYGPAIATGGANVTLLDMTYLYSTLANGGAIVGEAHQESGTRKLDPVALLKVTDGRGRTLYEFRGPKREQVVPAAQSYLITDILSDDSARSLIYQPGIFDLKDGRPLAAKTGTQQGGTVQEIRSTWNFGYVPDLSVGVWVGNADGTLVRNITSASSSLRIWRDFMQVAVDQLKIPSKPFPVPQGVARRSVTVPTKSGCKTVEDLVVVQGGQATATAGGCRLVKIDMRNGLLAGPDTPPEFVQEVAYVDAPPDVPDSALPGGVRVGAAPSAVSTITPTPSSTPTPTPSPTPSATPSATATVAPTRAATLPPRTVTVAPTSAPDEDTTATPAPTVTPRAATPAATARPAGPTALPATATAEPPATRPPAIVTVPPTPVRATPVTVPTVSGVRPVTTPTATAAP